MKHIILALLLSFSVIAPQNVTRTCLSNPCNIISTCTGQNNETLEVSDLAKETKIICKSGCWQLAKGFFFSPTNTTTHNPMIKIVSSHVVLDFAGQSVENTNTTNAGWIGIEVGYSPAELAANSSLRQPKDIVLTNINLRNFDCSILIHKGVERIAIQDSLLSDSSISIALLGDPSSFPALPSSQLNNEEVKNISITNTTILGHNQNKRTSLVNLKTLLETTYGYSTDLCMPLRADRLNSNVIDVYTYSGILATYCKNLFMSCLNIQSIGNNDFTSEGNGTRTQAIGIRLQDCDEVTIQQSKTTSTHGNVNAIGLQLERVCGINLYDTTFSYAQSNYLAVGIQSFPDFLAKTIDGLSSGFDYTLEEFDLCQVKTEFQRSASFSVGIYLTDARGINGDSVYAERNIANNSAFGLLTFTSSDISFTESSFSRNTAGMISTLKSKLYIFNTTSFLKRSLGNLGNNDGIHAIGWYAQECRNIHADSLNCDTNSGDNTARGMQLHNCTIAEYINSNFNNNYVTVGKRTNEDTDIRNAQDISEISKQGPTVPEAHTGGYGFVAEENSETITLKNCKAVNNIGHRATGVAFKDSKQIIIDQCKAMQQSSTGELFDNAAIQGLTATAIPLPAVQNNLFVSNACSPGTIFSSIDFPKLLQDYLLAAQNIRTALGTGSTPTAIDLRTVVAGISLATATLARFRLWGTAIGIHIHNGQKFIISNTTCTHQTSEHDSAIGILTSGRNSDFEILNCNTSYNEAWTNSQQALWSTSPDPNNLEQRYQYDLSDMRDFWITLLGPNSGTPFIVDVGSDVLALNYNPTSTQLAVGNTNNSNDTSIYPANSINPTQTLSNHTNTINDLAWKPDGTQLATCSDDNTIRIYNSSTWALTQTITTHTADVNEIAWKPDGTELASVGDNTDLIVFNSSTFATTYTYSATQALVTISFKPDGTQLAVVRTDGAWSPFTTSPWALGPVFNTGSTTNDVAWSPDDTQIAFATNNNLTIYDVPGFTITQTLTNHTGNVLSVAWNPSGTQLASGSADNTVIIWDASTWTPITTLTAHTGDVTALAWSPDGTKLATGSADNSFIVWNTSNWTILTEEAYSGFDTSGNNFIAQGEQNLTTGTIDPALPLVNVNGDNRILTPPIAPTAAGILLADVSTSGSVSVNLATSNFGNSGHGYGIALQNSFGCPIIDNNIFNNGSNVYGDGNGVLDISNYSPNYYVRNFLTNNKIKNLANSNTLIPMNDIAGNSLQLDALPNGSYNRDNRPLHNNAITIPIDPDACIVESSFDKALQSNITSTWINNSWIS